MHDSCMRSRPTLHATGSSRRQRTPQTGHVARVRGISPRVVVRPRAGRATAQPIVKAAAGPRPPQEGTLSRVADEFDRGASETADDDAVALRPSTRSAHRRTPSPLPPSTAWDSREWSCRRPAARATRRGSMTERRTVFT